VLDGSATTELVADRGIPGADATTCDSTTVLEFLAWGRKKDVDFANTPDHDNGPRRSSHPIEGVTTGPDVLTESMKSVQLDMLEVLLPSRNHITQLTSYHNDSLLWYHGSYSAKIIRTIWTSF
jgi:hypothetical protein